MLKQDLKDGDLNTMWSGESGGVAGTNSYKTWSLRPWRCAMSSIAAMASFTPPRSEVDTPCPTNISNECRLPTGDSMARLALRQRRGPFQLKPPGTLVPLSLFYNVWCPSPTQATKPLDRPCPQSDQCASNTSFKHVRCNPDIATRLTSGGYEDTVAVIPPINILFIGGGKL